MQKPAIEPIKARSTDPEDVEKYRLLVLVHRMAGSLAVTRDGEHTYRLFATPKGDSDETLC